MSRDLLCLPCAALALAALSTLSLAASIDPAATAAVLGFGSMVFALSSIVALVIGAAIRRMGGDE